MTDQQEIPPCNQEVYDRGESVCLVDVPKHTAEHICQSLNQVLVKHGVLIDWHYVCGRVHIKCLLPKTEQPE